MERLTKDALEQGRPERCRRMSLVFAGLRDIDVERVVLEYLSANSALVEKCCGTLMQSGRELAAERSARLSALIKKLQKRKKTAAHASDTWESKALLGLADQAAGWATSVALWRSDALKLQLHCDVASCRQDRKLRVCTLSYDFGDHMQLSDWEARGQWDITVAGLRPADKAPSAGDKDKTVLIFKYPISVPPKRLLGKSSVTRLLTVAVESTGRKASRGKWYCVLRKAGEPDFSQREEIKLDAHGLGCVEPPPKTETPFWLGIEHRGAGGVLSHVRIEAAVAVKDE